MKIGNLTSGTAPKLKDLHKTNQRLGVQGSKKSAWISLFVLLIGHDFFNKLTVFQKVVAVLWGLFHGVQHIQNTSE